MICTLLADHIALTAQKTSAAVVLGLFVGHVIGVTSAGSGALIAVGLIVLFKMRAAGTRHAAGCGHLTLRLRPPPRG